MLASTDRHTTEKKGVEFMGHAIHNKIDMVIDKHKLDELMDKRGFGQYKEVWQKIVERHAIGLNYKSFMNLLSNLVTWRLVYAYALSETLGVTMYDLYKIVPVTPTGVTSTREEELALATQGSAH
jgi:hypothetical protein